MSKIREGPREMGHLVGSCTEDRNARASLTRVEGSVLTGSRSTLSRGAMDSCLSTLHGVFIVRSVPT